MDTFRKYRVVSTRLMPLSASLSPVKRALQSTDTAEGLLDSCASHGSNADTDVCIRTGVWPTDCKEKPFLWVMQNYCLETNDNAHEKYLRTPDLAQTLMGTITILCLDV